jgi:hypothetical protein
MRSENTEAQKLLKELNERNNKIRNKEINFAEKLVEELKKK